MTLPAVPAQASPVPDASLWKAVLLRAGTALVFGAVTIFWSRPSVEVLAWAMGLYLLATAATIFLARNIPVVVPAVAAVAGLGALVTQSDAGVALSTALGLAALGGAELVQGLRRRGRNVLARDWLVSGVVGIGTAVALPFFVALGAHALLGVAGGGAIMSGVLWTLSGLTLRHDGRAAAPEAVN